MKIFNSILSKFHFWLAGKDMKHNIHMLKWVREQKDFHTEKVRLYMKAEQIYLKKVGLGGVK